MSAGLTKGSVPCFKLTQFFFGKCFDVAGALERMVALLGLEKGVLRGTHLCAEVLAACWTDFVVNEATKWMLLGMFLPFM